MRITQNMMNRNLLYSMNDNLDKLSELNEQISSGLRVRTVSDDVLAAGKVMQLQRENDRLDALLSNAARANTMLSFTTSTLQTASETITRIKELATQAATETYGANERAIMAEGVDELLETLVSMGNTQTQGAYVFSGESTHTTPFVEQRDADGKITSVSYVGASVGTEVSVGPGTSAAVNLVGRNVFQGDTDIYASVIQLRDAMRANDTDAINELLGTINDCHTQNRLLLGRLGERMDQMDVSKSSLESLQALNTQIISDNQDADIASVTVDYNSMYTLTQMVMKVAAQTVQPSIVDFL